MKQQYDSYKPSGIDWIGDIPSHWVSKRLRYVCEFRNGYTPSKANGDYWSEGTIPWYRMEDIRESGRFLKESKQYVSTEAVKGGGLFEAGSFILATTATIGEHAMLIVDSQANQQFTNLKIRKSLSHMVTKEFFFYYLFVIDEFCKSTTKTTTFPAMDMTDLRNFGVSIPPLAEQEAIAAWLDEKCGEIDAAIAKVDREIELIDELKQSEISCVVTRGLNPDAPLCPSGIDWIGDVPEHWIIAPFKRSLKINNGCDYKHIVSEEGYPVIGSGGQFAFASDYLYDGEVLLLGRKGTIDKPMHYIGKFWTVDTMFYAIPNNNVCCKYMYYQALGFPFDYYSTATALPSMAASDLANNPVIVPPLSEQQAIADYLDKKCAEIDGLKAKLSKKRETLKELRQSIVSEVVTGKRKVI